jgi:hypothetical protein
LVRYPCPFQVQTFSGRQRERCRDRLDASLTCCKAIGCAGAEALLERGAHVAGSAQTEAPLLGGEAGTSEATGGFTLLDGTTDERGLTSLPTQILRVEIVSFAQQTLRLVEPLLREGRVGLAGLLKFSLLRPHLRGHARADETGGEEGRRDFLETGGGTRQKTTGSSGSGGSSVSRTSGQTSGETRGTCTSGSRTGGSTSCTGSGKFSSDPRTDITTEGSR